LREANGWVILPPLQKRYLLMVAEARQVLGEETFAAAWAEGKRMTLEEAVRYAMEVA
jgi:hypothetical protein